MAATAALRLSVAMAKSCGIAGTKSREAWVIGSRGPREIWERVRFEPSPTLRGLCMRLIGLMECFRIRDGQFLHLPFLGLLFVGSLLGQAPKDQVYEPSLPPVSNDYTLSPDSKQQPNVPRGRIISFKLNDSKIFPGTTRDITIYIPAQYHPDGSACLYVGLDGLGFDAATVFDNLIAQHAMPVTIGVGIAPGQVSSAESKQNPRFDRSLEFDTMSDRLARFVIDEVLPEVQRQKTSTGERIVFSGDPNSHAIGGASTGGIASFTVAWERPDAFRRVFIAIGTFVGMRGGERYYVQVRKTEPKPLRIFEQDGVYDEWGGGAEIGDWWMSNLTMNRALEFAGYDVRHVWGAGNHNDSQAKAVFPDAMRWLWRDYPAPIKAKAPGNPRLGEIVIEGEPWKIASIGCGVRNRVAAKSDGAVVFNTHSQCTDSSSTEEAFAYATSGERVTALKQGGIGIATADGNSSRIIAPELQMQNLMVNSNGDVYATTAGSGGDALWLIRKSGDIIKLDDGLKGASGVALSPDGLWLMVGQSGAHQALSYRVLSDGKTDARESFYELYVPDDAEDSGAEGVAVDKNGWVYFATRLGIQICDRNGRVIAILPLPGNERALDITFGEKNFDTIYVSVEGGKVYARKLKTTGVPSTGARVELPKWGAG